LKGRSAGQRHTHTERETDRQTNLAENKGPAGFAIGLTKTRLKIMALQVCNLAKKGKMPSLENSWD